MVHGSTLPPVRASVQPPAELLRPVAWAGYWSSFDRAVSWRSGMGSVFRADQVGSLLRPPALLRAREAHAAGV
ncbi:MAG TPA: hypothetical protein VKY90_21260, partial [Candidatus Dormibacteraeota bacterium]|nr:hypothetical protein [Candidatus Dormibacteraeota bacterium]